MREKVSQIYKVQLNFSFTPVRRILIAEFINRSHFILTLKVTLMGMVLRKNRVQPVSKSVPKQR